MSKDTMLERASETTADIPEMFAKNIAGYPQWVFELRGTLYCKAKQHLRRRSPRGYRRPSGITWYRYLEQLGFRRLSPGAAPVIAR